MAQKLDDLETFDAAGMDLEIELPQRQAADDRKAFNIIDRQRLVVWQREFYEQLDSVKDFLLPASVAQADR